LESETSIYGVAQAKPKLENIFSSILTKRILKIKTNGGSFIQMSNFGLSYDEGVTQGVIYAPDARNKTNEPKLRLDPNTGRKVVQGGGILISGSFIAKYIPNYASIDPAVLLFSIKESVIKALRYKLDSFIDMRDIEIYKSGRLQYKLLGNSIHGNIFVAKTNNYLLTAANALT